MHMRLEILGSVLELGVLLLRKNAGYGNSAMDPLGVFSKAGVRERLAVRMDDKLSRIARGREDGQEDTRQDLCGYLTLDGIAARVEAGAAPRELGEVEALWREAVGIVVRGQGSGVGEEGGEEKEEFTTEAQRHRGEGEEGSAEAADGADGGKANKRQDAVGTLGELEELREELSAARRVNLGLVNEVDALRAALVKAGGAVHAEAAVGSGEEV